MFDDLYIVAYGASVVVDTTVLISVLDRRKWRYTAAPVALVVFAIWMFHVGVFSHKLVLESGSWSSWPRLSAMTLMATGLLLMPCAMLHSAIRVWRTGLQLIEKRDARYALCYLPMFAIPLIIRSIAENPMGNFLEQTAAFREAYLAAAITVNMIACGVFCSYRVSSSEPEVQRFLRTMGMMLAGLASILGVILWLSDSIVGPSQSGFVTLAILAPEALVVVLAYYVIRYNILQLVLERSMIYGSALAGILIFHQAVIANWGQHWGRSLGINLGVVETIGIAAIVLFYAPLRNRAAEALRYLVRAGTSESRIRVQQLASAIAQLEERPEESSLAWFAPRLSEAIDAPVQLWLFSASGETQMEAGSLAASSEDAWQLQTELAQRDENWLTLSTAPCSELLEAFRCNRAWLAIRWEQPFAQGLALIGRQHRGKELSGEQVSACVLLVDLFGSAMTANAIRREQVEVERRAMQNEKLSTLGLLTSCMTHEIRNPLSSIKTIAAVLKEQLAATESKESLELILDEVNRLSNTTSNLLQFARPASVRKGACDLAAVSRSLSLVLNHLALRHKVKLTIDIDEATPIIAADDEAMRDVLMNLMLNALQAVPTGGSVTVSCDSGVNGQVAIRVADNGPGIPPELRDRLYEPFVTSKADGSGLGLYIVNRRMRELGGEISYCSSPENGTTFVVTLPITGDANLR